MSYGPEEMAREAVELFKSGYHCSQAIFAVGAKLLGRQAPDVADVVSALAPFGGGLGSTGRVCGSLPGALAAIGLTLGKAEPGQRDHKAMWRLSYKMVKEFEAITGPYGGMECKDIARVNWKDIKEVKAFRKDPDSRQKECHRVIAETARALGGLLGDLER